MHRLATFSAGLFVVTASLTGCSEGAAPTSKPVATSPSQTAFVLYTHCGIDELQLDGRWYERVGGRLDDGSGNPPPGWGNPEQEGQIERLGDAVTFTDSNGHRESFRRRAKATEPKHLCA